MGDTVWPLWINGAAVRTGQTFEVFDKFTGMPLAQVALAAEEHLHLALESAQSSLPAIAALSVDERLVLLDRWAELARARRSEFEQLTVGEVGRPVKLVETFFEYGLDIVARYRDYIVDCYGSTDKLFAPRLAPVPGRRAYYRWEPKGVLGLCLPANDSLSLFWEKIAPMFLAGNAVVVKPATATPLGTLLAIELARKAGFPAGAINGIVGPSEPLTRAMIANPICDYIQFVGRADHGVALGQLAVVQHKEFDGEYEGNDWLLVLDDADLDHAARAIVAGLTINSGQICMHIQGVLVDARVYDALAKRLVALVRSLKVGDPRDPKTDLGPLVNAGQVGRTLQQIEQAVSQGAKVLVGGQGSGACLDPTVVTDVTAEMGLVREESFAPVLWLRAVSGVEEMLDWAAWNRHRLTITIFSRNIERAEETAARLRFSRVVINADPTAVQHPYHPWGGLGISGQGGMIPWFERYTYKKFVEMPVQQ